MNNWPCKSKNIWKLNNASVHSLVVSAKGMVTKCILKYIENTRLTKSFKRVGQEAVLLQTCYIVRKFLELTLSLGDRVNFLLLIKPNPTD